MADKKEKDEEAKVAEASTDDVEASGAIIEGDVKSDIPMDHPAVDSNPRANTTPEMNAIDFNDPTKGASEAVKEGLTTKPKDAKKGK